jgi:hypothetical protein
MSYSRVYGNPDEARRRACLTGATMTPSPSSVGAHLTTRPFGVRERHGDVPCTSRPSSVRARTHHNSNSQYVEVVDSRSLKQMLQLCHRDLLQEFQRATVVDRVTVVTMCVYRPHRRSSRRLT